MDLAKPHVDVGLFTNALEPMLEFWQREVGLAFEQALPLGGGLVQHRHAMNGSVFKLNHSRDPLPEAAPSGYRELSIAREGLDAERALVDPDGNRVRLVPVGSGGLVGIALRLGVRDVAASRRFYGETLELPAAGDDAFRCGDSILAIEADPTATVDPTWIAGGYRYFTIQIRNIDDEHRGILARGGREGRAPMTIGDVARISFVRDPDGNWIEVSQRASLTGALPPGGSASLF